jgi:hypothetical protein
MSLVETENILHHDAAQYDGQDPQESHESIVHRRERLGTVPALSGEIFHPFDEQGRCTCWEFHRSNESRQAIQERLWSMTRLSVVKMNCVYIEKTERVVVPVNDDEILKLVVVGGTATTSRSADRQVVISQCV